MTRAELEALALRCEQPIETAPRNNRIVVVSDERGRSVKAFWTQTCGGEGWHTLAPETSRHLIEPIDFEPTHWSLSASAPLDEPSTD